MFFLLSKELFARKIQVFLLLNIAWSVLAFFPPEGDHLLANLTYGHGEVYVGS